jgi:hypothetical protein
MTIDREDTGFGPGSETASAPRVPGAPTFSANGTGTITINAPDDMGNDPVVTYSLRLMQDPELDGSYVLAGYVQADGRVDAGEVFRTLTAWGATIAVSGLTVVYAYTFASRAQNELGVNSAWSAESAVMNTLPALDEGLNGDNLEYELSGGNTKVDDEYGLVITGTSVPEITATTEYYGDITATFKAINYDSEASSVEVEFSENSGVDYLPATGSPKSGITTSPDGTVNTFTFDSYTDCGRSEHKTTVRLRARGIDPESAASAWVESADFIVNNRPAPIDWHFAEYIGGKWVTSSKEFDKASPNFIALIPSLRGGTGTVGYPEITIALAATSEVVSGYPKKAFESIAGWKYETALDTWVDLTPAGIPYAKAGGTLRLLYSPTGLAAEEYIVYGRMWETRAV